MKHDFRYCGVRRTQQMILRSCCGILAASFVLTAGRDLVADDLANDAKVDAGAIRLAVQKSIPVLEAGTMGSAKERQCFTCHSQAVPVFALAAASHRGFEIDKDNFAKQIRHTLAHLERGKADYLQGKPQGGQVLTAGYALWTLEDGQHPPDETTAAVAHFLLEYQKERTHWVHRGNRPPTSGSDFTATYVTIRGLHHYATDEQRDAVTARIKTVGEWVLKEVPKETEDHVFRLKILPYLEAPPETTESAVAAILNLQQTDGGWCQKDGMASDAYATATVVETLLADGGVSAGHQAIQKGIRYLLQTQKEDGTWHVVTRAVPIQTYFESGFPHGKDQFISISATAWATLALLNSLPAEPAAQPVAGTSAASN